MFCSYDWGIYKGPESLDFSDFMRQLCTSLCLNLSLQISSIHCTEGNRRSYTDTNHQVLCLLGCYQRKVWCIFASFETSLVNGYMFESDPCISLLMLFLLVAAVGLCTIKFLEVRLRKEYHSDVIFRALLGCKRYDQPWIFNKVWKRKIWFKNN